MNLTDLQIQLRSIEEHISSLQMEIEKMKPQPEEEKKVMFEKITNIASKYPLENRRLNKDSEIDVKTYISCLAYISFVDESNIYAKFLYICRLSYAMGLTFSSEEIFKMGLEFDEKYFDKACSNLKNHKYTFLTDALILVNLNKDTTESSLRLVADIAHIFECDKDDIYVAAMVAKAVLTDNYNGLKKILTHKKNRWMGKFNEHIPKAWIKTQRIKCGELCLEIHKGTKLPNKQYPWESNDVIKKPCVIKNRVKAGSFVELGDVLISYEESVQNESVRLHPLLKTPLVGFETGMVKKSITAPHNGIVFFIENNKMDSSKNQIEKYIVIYMVSYFDDYMDFCNWYKKE